jgi:hypothetical protein
VRGTLRDELGGCQCAVLYCAARVERARVVFGGRTAAGSSSRSMLAAGFGWYSLSLRECSVRVLVGGRDSVYGSLLESSESRCSTGVGLGFRLLLWRPCAHGNGGRTAAAAAATLSRARGGCGQVPGAYVTDGFHKTALPLRVAVHPACAYYLGIRVAAASPRLCTFASAPSHTSSQHVAVATM